MVLVIHHYKQVIRVHLRTNTEMSEAMNKAIVTITVDGRELKADG
jgi:hypothetical protein